jgi:hypothetical protein
MLQEERLSRSHSNRRPLPVSPYRSPTLHPPYPRDALAQPHEARVHEPVSTHVT